jgi:hypothetical protein
MYHAAHNEIESGLAMSMTYELNKLKFAINPVSFSLLI